MLVVEGRGGRPPCRAERRQELVKVGLPPKAARWVVTVHDPLRTPSNCGEAVKLWYTAAPSDGECQQAGQCPLDGKSNQGFFVEEIGDPQPSHSPSGRFRDWTGVGQLTVWGDMPVRCFKVQSVRWETSRSAKHVTSSPNGSEIGSVPEQTGVLSWK